MKTNALESRTLKIVLIKPSKYDDEGYVIRHLRGVLPSNTLACLYSLTEDLKQRRALGENVKIDIQVVDDAIQKIPAGRIIRSHRPPRSVTVVGLVGVQSNQFPRAADLARRFRRAGLPVLIGGFHVSGSLSLISEPGPEIRELLDEGVTIVKGEVEESWGDILQDALNDRLPSLYDFLDRKPELTSRPAPMFPKGYLKRFMSSHLGTIDCGRGCPYNCSFCTVINVQGRKMRFRAVEDLRRALRENYRRLGVYFYFFTDDNFARHQSWREILGMITELREKESVPIQFMMQVDAQAYKIPDFVSMAARAGCTQAFIGLESINPENLKASGKGQNRVREYKDMMAAWHEAGVVTHVAYIIGFPFDTPESVKEDIAHLQRELKVEQASFFMMTPIPGSRDHERMLREGVRIDPDLNKYDSFHEAMPHPNFKPGEWYESYRNAWESFYSFGYMREVLTRARADKYWNIFLNFIWYKNSALIEGGHPMLHGFFRLKHRTDRRPGFAVESRLAHFRRRSREIRKLLRAWVALLLEMEELWLQTRKRSEAELRLIDELKRMRKELNRGLRSAELQLAHVRAGIQVPELRVPSRLVLKFRFLNFGVAKRITYTRADLEQFWSRGRKRWGKKFLFLVHPCRTALNLARDAQLFLLFLRAMMRASGQNRATNFRT